jgi:hypothetical protein
MAQQHTNGSDAQSSPATHCVCCAARRGPLSRTITRPPAETSNKRDSTPTTPPTAADSASDATTKRPPATNPADGMTRTPLNPQPAATVGGDPRLAGGN